MAHLNSKPMCTAAVTLGYVEGQLLRGNPGVWSRG